MAEKRSHYSMRQRETDRRPEVTYQRLRYLLIDCSDAKRKLPGGNAAAFSNEFRSSIVDDDTHFHAASAWPNREIGCRLARFQMLRLA